MKRSTSLNNGFALIIGAFLILEGLWGLGDEVVFGVLSTNKAHASIHLLLGVLAVGFGLKQNARNYTIFLGLLLLVVGSLRFVPGADAVLINLLNVNENVAFLNIILGAVALAVAAPKPVVIAEDQETIANTSAHRSTRSHRITSTPIQKHKPAESKTKKTPEVKNKDVENKVENKINDTKKKAKSRVKNNVDKVVPVVKSVKKEMAPESPQRQKSTSKKNARKKSKPLTGDKA